MSVETTASYLGLSLSSPILIGACPLTRNPEFVRSAAVAGAGAIVLPSVFEEQIVHKMMDQGKSVSPREERVEAACFRPSEDEYNGGTEAYLEVIESLRRQTGIPIIASLNGYTDGDWLRFAQSIEQAGASALEVTLEPDLTDPEISGDQVEEQMLGSLRQLCDLVSLPISVKLASQHTNLCNLAWRVVEAGGSALVCFAHEPTWKIELDSISALPQWGLTQAGNINPTISGLLRIRSQGPGIDLAASGGIASVSDVINCVVAGANAVMITSEIYRSGPDVISHLNDGLMSYLNRHGFESFEALTDSRPNLKPFLRSMHSNYVVSREAPENLGSMAMHVGDRWGHAD